MKKQKWKPGNMIYPLPAIMVSCGDKECANIITVAWTGTICTNPPMTYISIRPERYSYNLIKEKGYYVINLTTRKLLNAVDFCGVRSGKDCDKFKLMQLHPQFVSETGCPMIEESPVNIECKVKEIKELGSHHMFISDVINVYVDEQYIDRNNKFHLNDSKLVTYSHGAYFTLGEQIGTFGCSVTKKKKKTKRPSNMK